MRKLRILALFFLIAASGVLSAQEGTRNYDKEALNHINTINQLLERQTELPFDKFIESELSKLNDLKPQIEDEKLLRQIDLTIDAYYEKMDELKEAAATKESEARAAAEAKAKQDSTNAAQAAQQLKEEQEAKEKEEKKSRNIMIIVGAVLAVAMFGANQLIQHLRNKKTQRSIMDMQKTASQAGSTIQKKAESRVRKETTKLAGQARQKGKNAFKKLGKTGKKGKNNRISI